MPVGLMQLSVICNILASLSALRLSDLYNILSIVIQVVVFVRYTFSLLSSWSFGIFLFELFSFGQEPFKQVPSEGFLQFLRDGNRLEQPEFANEKV